VKQIVLKLTGLKMIYAVLGLFYSVLQVRIFGVSREVEAFFIANTAVYLIVSLTQGGQISELFLPQYLSIKEKYGKEYAHRAFSVLINRFTVFATLLLFVVYFISPFILQLMAPGFSSEDKELSVAMFRAFLLLIELQIINSFINTTLNAEKIFGRVEWTAILNSIFSLIILFLFHKILGIWVLVIALLFGKIIEFVISILYIKKANIKYSLIWTEKNFDFTPFFKSMFSTSGYVVSVQIRNVVFTSIATLLPAGTYAIFKYIQQLEVKISNIFLTPLSTVFFSNFSSCVSQKKQLEKNNKKTVFISFIVAIFFTCLFFLVGKEIIYLLWKSPKMDDYFLNIGYWMLVINFISFSIYSAGHIYRKVAISLGGGRRLYVMWTFAQLFLSILTYFTITPLGWIGLPINNLINTFLMVLVIIYIAKNSGIDIIKTFEVKELISIIISWLLFCSITILMNMYWHLSIPLIQNILLKLSIGILLGGGLLYFRHKHLYKKVQSLAINYMKTHKFI
jgi:putative peptidoglycan lipid II flippase